LSVILNDIFANNFDSEACMYSGISTVLLLRPMYKWHYDNAPWWM